ncbi:hypothetical protein [Synechocystis sp. LKSZ1]|uniref:hypothetical protein n=1 Tax=Synechocystis sp. LKSZ1 TaxID=3144951 RepID=UPI00336BB3BD
MNLKPQLQLLLTDMPGRALSPEVVEQILFPTLIPIAKRLGSSTFYTFVEQGEGNYAPVSFTLAHNFKPNETPKNVVMSFKCRADALRYPDFEPERMEVVQRGVIFLLLDLITYPEVDAGFFYVQKGNLKQGIEVTTQSLSQRLRETQQLRGVDISMADSRLA